MFVNINLLRELLFSIVNEKKIEYYKFWTSVTAAVEVNLLHVFVKGEGNFFKVFWF